MHIATGDADKDIASAPTIRKTMLPLAVRRSLATAFIPGKAKLAIAGRIATNNMILTAARRDISSAAWWGVFLVVSDSY